MMALLRTLLVGLVAAPSVACTALSPPTTGDARVGFDGGGDANPEASRDPLASASIVPLPTELPVSVLVLDINTALPIRTARVTASASTAVFDPAVAGFTFPSLRPGRATVSVEATDYYPITRDISVLPDQAPIRFLLQHRSVPQIIGPAGGRISAGGAGVAFPPNALPTPQSIVVTWSRRQEIASFPAAGVFLDGARVYLLLGILRVELAVQPSLNVSVTLPVSPIQAAPRLRAVELGTNRRWVARPSAVSFADGVASVDIDHFSEVGIAEEVDATDPCNMFVVSDVNGTAMAVLPDGRSRTLEPGDLVPGNARVTTGSGAVLTVTNPVDGQLTLGSRSDVVFAQDYRPPGLLALWPDLSRVRCGLSLFKGRATAVMRSEFPLHRVWTWATGRAGDLLGIEDEGTIFSLSVDDCPTTTRDLVSISVGEGRVGLSSGQSTRSVTGSVLSTCLGCQPGDSQTCDSCAYVCRSVSPCARASFNEGDCRRIDPQYSCYQQDRRLPGGECCPTGCVAGTLPHVFCCPSGVDPREQ